MHNINYDIINSSNIFRGNSVLFKYPTYKDTMHCDTRGQACLLLPHTHMLSFLNMTQLDPYSLSLNEEWFESAFNTEAKHFIRTTNQLFPNENNRYTWTAT